MAADIRLITITLAQFEAFQSIAATNAKSRLCDFLSQADPALTLGHPRETLEGFAEAALGECAAHGLKSVGAASLFITVFLSSGEKAAAAFNDLLQILRDTGRMEEDRVSAASLMLTDLEFGLEAGLRGQQGDYTYEPDL